MRQSNGKRIEKVGFIAESSDHPSIPSPKGIIQVGLYRQPPGRHPGCAVSDPTPNYWKLEEGRELVELVTAGRGWVREGDEWKEVTPGALLWHLPGDQSIGMSDWSNPYHCLTVAFEIPRRLVGRRTIRIARWEDLDEVAKFAEEVIRWNLDERFDRSALFHYTYGRLLFQSRLWQRNEEHAEHSPKLRQAVEWIERHFAEPFSLEDVARIAEWSVPHLHEVFRQKLDITPYQFVLARRIKAAKERLAASNVPIKQLAADCGFSNTAVFCHAFRSRVGVTPLSYRRQKGEWMEAITTPQ